MPAPSIDSATDMFYAKSMFKGLNKIHHHHSFNSEKEVISWS